MARKKHSKAPQKPQGKCIFCDGHGMTKQHIWPNWISRSEIAANSKRSKETSNTQNISGALIKHSPGANRIDIVPQQRRVTHKGSRLSRRLRMVCARCNNGWMSDIENESKEIILALQSHSPVIVSPADSLHLAKWIVLMTIVAEFTDIPNKKISIEERKQFYRERKPLEGWQIWVGKYKGSEWDLGYRHSAYGIAGEGVKRGGVAHERIFTIGAQNSIFGIGGLVLYVVSPSGELDKNYFSGATINSMQRIWPLPDDSILWQSLPVNSDSDVNALFKLFEDNMHTLSTRLMQS